MTSMFDKAVRRIQRFLYHRRYRILYWWFHKHKFKITNTKFDISYIVFQESFIQDQYDIRLFLDSIGKASNLFFLDIGRNHGFVFYYTMYHIMRSKFKTSVVNYVGIDPSPLKFVYFNYFAFLRQENIQINYFLLDRAVVFDNEKNVKLKYGEDNFGNFNIDTSNYAQKLAPRQQRFSYVEITVETIGLGEIREIINLHKGADAMIIKIDCKNQTSRLFLEMLDSLNDYANPYLIACEKDDSCDHNKLTRYSKPGLNVLTATNMVK